MSPFGSPDSYRGPGRSWSDASREYRYGFNGKEKHKEGMGGGGSTYDYGFRIYNSNLGRFLSVDPLTFNYPWYSSYQYAGNKPIFAIDIDGLEEKPTNSGPINIIIPDQYNPMEFNVKVQDAIQKLNSSTV